MFLIDGTLHWSASDLTAAAACEYAVLRTLDYKVKRADPIEGKKDPLLEHIGRLGDRHEARLLEELKSQCNVAELDHIDPPYTMAKVEAAGDATLQAFMSAPDVIYQAAFFDGEFFGYADFIERADDGWVVCDAKLARSAKPSALLQLGAYADQIQRMHLPLSSTVSLLLGNGERADFCVSDVLPVFIERRERLRHLLTSHMIGGVPVVWGDGRITACGTCAECSASAKATNDVIGVAGLRMEQRRKLHAAQPSIRTIADLAAAPVKPDGMASTTFDKLRAQAALQWKQMQTAQASVAFELTATAPKMLALLPAPSEGDLFFDFEGDPLYDEGDLSRIGLEYLWGVMDTAEQYVPTWAHNSAEERHAFISFMDDVAKRRAQHPDMHIYHYAPYETTALKRLAMRYQTKEKELDDLLRSEVFVDLYATVRGSVRVGQPSYSIKKLEPLYMGDQLRSDDDDAVGDGGASVVAYHEYRDLRVDDPAAAKVRTDALSEYNEYDCLSTLRLRDWLLKRADEAGVRDQIVPRIKKVEGEELSEEDPVFLALMAKSGPEQRSKRTPQEQAYALLATSLDYYRRERKQYWWEHFERLGHLVDDWSDARDVFVVESATVVQDWAVPEGKATNARRVVRLVGGWTPGSKASARARVVYSTPGPPGSFAPDGAPYGAADSAGVETDPEDPRVVLLTESRKPGDTFSDLPVALIPATPPDTRNIEAAIREMGMAAATASSLPSRAAFDILTRRAPRVLGNASLPVRQSTLDSVVAALIGMNDSYVAIQGPPGTGKTHTGSHVVKELVEKHRWRIGVVAQSHAVVEHMLAGIVTKAGLDASLVGKCKTDSDSPEWTPLKSMPKFLDEHAATGCVIGGTAWDFANENTVGRGSLDLLIIDEAGQFSLAPTIGASVAAHRLLLLGDPQQLPQVSQGSHAEPVDESALGWLMDGHDTIPTDLGYFLGESYRLHPELCAKVSTLSYAGRLNAAPAAAQRSLEGVEPGLHVIALGHIGNRTESPEEAVEVVAQVQALIGACWTDPDDETTPRPLSQSDFLVVAPYNAQVALIRAALAAAGLSRVRVGTVDKFQGQEEPIAIVSTTASAHGDVPRGMGFLLSRNRVNVAVSRAQWRTVLIRSEALTSFMPKSAHGFLELGAFIGLCQPTEESDWREESGGSDMSNVHR